MLLLAAETLHWPRLNKALGLITGDFNICEPEEGKFYSWNKTFTDGDAGMAALFRSFFFFPHVHEICFV